MHKYRGKISITVIGNGFSNLSSNPKLGCLHVTAYEKALIYIFSLQLGANNRADWVF